MKNWFKTVSSLAFCFCIAVLNQNCGAQSSFSGNEELASIHGPDILDVPQPSSKARVGERIFISSVLADAFLPQNTASRTEADAVSQGGPRVKHIYKFITKNYDVASGDKIISDMIVDNILRKVSEFQGSCSVTDMDDSCVRKGDTANSMAQAGVDAVATGTVTREGYRLSACKKIIDRGRAVFNLVLNITGKRSAQFSKEYIMDVYNLFYPGQKIDEEAYYSLVEAAEVAIAGGENNINVWRSVITPICYSAGWQIP